MKNKYMRLSKEERKDAVKQFREKSENGEYIYKRINRLRIVSILGICYSVINFILDLVFSTNNVWNYVIDGFLLIFCIAFLFKANDILVNQVNSFLINEGKKKENSKKNKK